MLTFDWCLYLCRILSNLYFLVKMNVVLGKKKIQWPNGFLVTPQLGAVC